MQHVRAQNWFAVVIDVLVVFGSVLLATQIAVAIDDAKSQRDLESSMRNLSSEISRQNQWMHSAINWQKRRMAGLRDALAILDGAQPEEYDQGRILLALTEGTDPSLLHQHYPTLDEMINTGRFKEVPQPLLRSILQELAFISATADPENRRNEGTANRSPLHYDFIDWEINSDPEIWVWGTARISHVDWEKARASHDFRMRIYQAHGALARSATLMYYSIVLSDEVLLELKRAGFQPASDWWSENRARVFEAAPPWYEDQTPGTEQP